MGHAKYYPMGRPQFETIEKMNEYLISQWNDHVDVNDFHPVDFDELFENNDRFYGVRAVID